MRRSAICCLVLIAMSAGATAYGDPVDFTSSNLPIVLIDTAGQEIPNEPKITATMRIIDNGPGLRNVVTDPPLGYDGFIGIELHGWSSQFFYPKKGYGVETRDATGENLNVSLLGMPEENDWVLYAPYGDKSMMRNALGYQLARDMGWWAPRTRYCEVVLNDEYIGIYVLIEKIKQDSERINLDDPVDGQDECGFLAVMTPELQVETGDITVTNTLSGRHWVIKYPKDEDVTAGHVAAIGQQIDDVDAALFVDSPGDWRPLLDVASFADVIMLNELTRNYDAFSASTFVYSNADDVLHLGPVWDYNIAFGNIDYPPEERDWETDGWTQDNVVWAETFLADPFFSEQMARDWSRRRLDVLDHDHLDDWFDEHLALLDEAQARNFERWPILGDHVWPNYYVGETWADEVSWLRQWLHDRLDWLDSQWLGPLQSDPMVNEINYNSSDAFDPDDWVEFFNPGLDTLDVAGWTFRDEDDRNGLTLAADTRLAPGEYLVLCRDRATFSAAYPDVTVAGEFPFGLSGGGERLRLFDAGGLLVDHVDYDDEAPWPLVADGDGPTLELLSPRQDNALVDSWAASAGFGTPGAANSAFADDVWLLTFTVARVPEGAQLQWTVLGDGAAVVARARKTDRHWTVPVVDEGGGAYSALDIDFDPSDGGVSYELYHQPTTGDEILLGARSLAGAAPAVPLVLTVAPNPIVEDATITAELGSDSILRIVVYDLAGRFVATVFDGRHAAGPVVETWTPRGLASGVYFVCLESEAGREARKVTVLR